MRTYIIILVLFTPLLISYNSDAGQKLYPDPRSYPVQVVIDGNMLNETVHADFAQLRHFDNPCLVTISHYELSDYYYIQVSNLERNILFHQINIRRPEDNLNEKSWFTWVGIYDTDQDGISEGYFLFKYYDKLVLYQLDFDTEKYKACYTYKIHPQLIKNDFPDVTIEFELEYNQPDSESMILARITTGFLEQPREIIGLESIFPWQERFRLKFGTMFIKPSMFGKAENSSIFWGSHSLCNSHEFIDFEDKFEIFDTDGHILCSTSAGEVKWILNTGKGGGSTWISLSAGENEKLFAVRSKESFSGEQDITTLLKINPSNGEIIKQAKRNGKIFLPFENRNDQDFPFFGVLSSGPEEITLQHINQDFDVIKEVVIDAGDNSRFNANITLKMLEDEYVRLTQSNGFDELYDYTTGKIVARTPYREVKRLNESDVSRNNHVVFFNLETRTFSVGHYESVPFINWWSFRHRYLIIIGGGLALILLIIWITSVYSRYKRKTKDELREKNEKLQEHNEKLKLLNFKMQSIQEIERKRNASLVHNKLRGNMTVCRQMLNSIIKQNDLDDQYARVISEVVTNLNELGEISRDLHDGLYPALIARGQYLHAFLTYVSQMSDNHLINFVFESNVKVERNDLNEKLMLTFYRVMEQACINIINHAEADNVNISLIQQNGNMEFRIEDDGKGFDLLEAKKKKTLGLFEMKEKIKVWSGELTIDTGIGQGTKIIASVPYPPEIEKIEVWYDQSVISR